MMNFGAALLLGALLPVAAIHTLRGTSNSMDLTVALSDMHPEQVGTLLHTVESRWEEARASSLRNLTDENVGLEDMVKSCSKVAKAIIAGSDGDKDKVVEYMNDVCAASENEQCKPFASGIEGSMTDDAGFNRNNLELSKFCQSFWSGPVTNAAKVLAQKASEEDAAKAKEEAKVQEEKTNEALAVTINQTTEAIQRASKVEEQVKDLETSMAADAAEATKALDNARQEEQVANEKDAKADEAKVAAADAAAESDEAKALEEGDAKADAIAAKATQKAEAAEAAAPVEESTGAAAQDDAEAIAAGDAVAQKIADKALKKEAALVAAKQQKVTKNVTKNGTKVEVAKKF